MNRLKVSWIREKGVKMRRPYAINNDGEFKTLQDCIEQLALSIADDVANNEKIEKIQSECKILDSLTIALLAIKN